MIEVRQGDDFLLEVAFILFELYRIAIIGDQFFDNHSFVVQAFIGCQQRRTHTALTEHLIDHIATSLQGSTNVECTRVVIRSTGYRGAAGISGCRANEFAAVAAIANAVAIFCLTVGTFHLSPTLPSPIFGISIQTIPSHLIILGFAILVEWGRDNGFSLRIYVICKQKLSGGEGNNRCRETGRFIAGLSVH